MTPRFSWLGRLAGTALTLSSLSDAQTAPNNPFLPRSISAKSSGVDFSHTEAATPDFDVLDEFLGALHVMQDVYFTPWLGTWPDAIDWTAAVMGTHVAASLSSISHSLAMQDDVKSAENLITTYFSHLLSYYFGQDSFAIRNEAYDDMLWVVLGWLEAIEFVDYHSTVYHTPVDEDNDHCRRTKSLPPSIRPETVEMVKNQTWYGNVWVPAFAHRARIFWDLASHGWNETLCSGGMIWNPRLEPYKNAITNELYIAASISMYLYFPGDPNVSPFDRADPRGQDTSAFSEPHQKKHLEAAVSGYRWLVDSGMMNHQGLYTDGFHIRNWNNISDPRTECDARNDMVYTYNQGVLLTGQIGLWKVSGNKQYLHDGHRLVQSVIKATGYDLDHDKPVDAISELRPGQLPPWRGLGRAGVLEEMCDITGRCSQDSQTFKGIFFHHLTSFCAPLDIVSSKDDASEVEVLAEFHRQACISYLGWIRHNAVAALATKDDNGKFGMWWTVGLLQITAAAADTASPNPQPGNGAVDYRTDGVPQDELWTPLLRSESGFDGGGSPVSFREQKNDGQAPLGKRMTEHWQAGGRRPGGLTDPNSRGRGPNCRNTRRRTGRPPFPVGNHSQHDGMNDYGCYMGYA